MSCKSALYAVLQTPTAVAIDGVIPLGSLIRRYGCDISLNGNAVNLTGTGYYDVDASITVAPTAAGTVTATLVKDGVAIPGAEAWCAKMANEDGTTGPHWTMEQTTAVAESVGVVFDQLAPWCWWAAMCMMYSDYCGVASRYGVGTAEFYADMAKAFLFDRDAGGPRAKMAAYYHGIAEHGK